MLFGSSSDAGTLDLRRELAQAARESVRSTLLRQEASIGSAAAGESFRGNRLLSPCSARQVAVQELDRGEKSRKALEELLDAVGIDEVPQPDDILRHIARAEGMIFVHRNARELLDTVLRAGQGAPARMKDVIDVLRRLPGLVGRLDSKLNENSERLRTQGTENTYRSSFAAGAGTARDAAAGAIGSAESLRVVSRRSAIWRKRSMRSALAKWMTDQQVFLAGEQSWAETELQLWKEVRDAMWTVSRTRERAIQVENLLPHIRRAWLIVWERPESKELRAAFPDVHLEENMLTIDAGAPADLQIGKLFSAAEGREQATALSEE